MQKQRLAESASGPAAAHGGEDDGNADGRPRRRFGHRQALVLPESVHCGRPGRASLLLTPTPSPPPSRWPLPPRIPAATTAMIAMTATQATPSPLPSRPLPLPPTRPNRTTRTRNKGTLGAMVAAKAAATPLPSPPPRRSWPAARGHGRVRPRDVACYVFNGLCDGASEAEELPAASITRSLNVPVLMIYVCTHSEVLAVSVLVSVWFENIYRSEPVLPLLYSRRVSCYIVSHAGPCRLVAFLAPTGMFTFTTGLPRDPPTQPQPPPARGQHPC